MSDFFYAESKAGARVLHRKADIDWVADQGDGIRIGFRDGSEIDTTTYDMHGFISNVLEDSALLDAIDGE